MRVPVVPTLRTLILQNEGMEREVEREVGEREREKHTHTPTHTDRQTERALSHCLIPDECECVQCAAALSLSCSALREDDLATTYSTTWSRRRVLHREKKGEREGGNGREREMSSTGSPSNPRDDFISGKGLFGVVGRSVGLELLQLSLSLPVIL